MVSPMVQMSRAIRHVLEDHGPKLSDVSTEVLEQFVQIAGAFYYDMKDELDRRKQVRTAMRRVKDA